MALDRPIALQLPTMSASEAQARAHIARTQIKLKLTQAPGAAEPPTLSLALVSGTELSHPWTTPAVVERLAFEWSGSRFFLDLTPAALNEWMAATLPGISLREVPPAWSDAAVEAAVGWLTTGLSQIQKGSLRFVGHSEQQLSVPAGVRHLLTLTLTFESAGHQIPGVIHTDSLGLILLAQSLPSQTQAVAADHQGQEVWESLPVLLQLSLGTTDVPFDQMRALTQGDVVFISKRFIDEQQHLKLRSPAFGGRCWSVSARYEAHQLLLTESPTIMSDTADNPETAAGTADTANTAHPDTINSLQQLPIRLSFDVGQKTLSWHQMTQLQSGDTVSLDGPTSQYVTIRANGAVIGRGHLVEIDNRLGVAVDAIVHPGSAPSNEAAA